MSSICLYLETDKCLSLIFVFNSDFSCSEVLLVGVCIQMSFSYRHIYEYFLQNKVYVLVSI